MRNMSPNAVESGTVLSECERQQKVKEHEVPPRKYVIVYRNMLTFGYVHAAALYGLYLCFTSAKWGTILLLPVFFSIAEIGVIVGAHRLWSHKSFKVTRFLEIILMLCNSAAFQNTATDWVRDHRMHHKYSDTDGDPHNSSRGFFFSHIGWCLVKKHPDIKKYGRTIEMSDIYSNPVLRFQKKYAIPLIATCCFGLPTIIPMYFWGETLNNAWHIMLLRYVLNLHGTFLVNSAAHLYGYKPYEVKIQAANNILTSLPTFGEGFHNYHHVYPYDYRSAELGNNILNISALAIDFFAWIGWAYDLKTVSAETIKKRAKRTGDGSNLWGWKDLDVSMQNKGMTSTLSSNNNK